MIGKLVHRYGQDFFSPQNPFCAFINLPFVHTMNVAVISCLMLLISRYYSVVTQQNYSTQINLLIAEIFWPESLDFFRNFLGHLISIYFGEVYGQKPKFIFHIFIYPCFVIAFNFNIKYNLFSTLPHRFLIPHLLQTFTLNFQGNPILF